MLDLQAEEHRCTVARNLDHDARSGVSTGHLDAAQMYLGPLAREVPLAIDWLQADRRNPLNKFAAVLRGLDPQIIALCALQHGLVAVSTGADIGETDRHLGAALAGEIVNALLDDDNRAKLVKQAKASRGDMAAKVEFAFLAAKRLGIKKVDDALDNLTMRHAGAWLRSVLLSCLPDVFVISDDNHHLHLTEEAEGAVSALVDAALERNPVFLPMRTPPRPWRSLFGGGPVDGRQKHVAVLRSRAKPVKAAVKAAAADGTLQPALDALNALQATPWRINARVLGAMEACIAAGIEVDGIPKAKRPRVTLKKMFPGVKEFAELSVAEKGTFMSERAKVRAYNSGVVSETVALKIALKTAHMFEDADRFYTPMNMDFRGRVYNICQFHFQREDRVRALFEFADGEPLGPDGLYWLKVHVANCWAEDNGKGLKTDKIPFDQRVQWVDENLERICSLTDAYLKELWWTKADSPFLFLAACFELTSAVSNTGKPSSYVCRLPVSFDGSCSGIQHLSLMTRSRSEAALVNLLPSNNSIADVYATVAHLVLQRITADAAHTTWEEEHAWKGVIARRCLELHESGVFKIDRKVAKRNVMTFSYGSKSHGMQGQQQVDTMDKLRDKVIEGRLAKHPFEVMGPDGRSLGFERGTMEKPGKAARYLGDQCHKAIQEVIYGPAGAMRFLQTIAKALAHEGKVMRWTTPVGIPWLNRYLNVQVEQVRLWLYDRGVRAVNGAHNRVLVATGEDNEVAKEKCANASAPNFVHANDAAHLLLVARAAQSAGFRLATVHDSFGCLPSRAGALRALLLQELVRMYSEHDVLAQVLAAAHEDITDANRHRLPELPSKGDLNLEEVLHAEYAFA